MADHARSRALLGIPLDAFAAWHDPHAEDVAYWSLAAAYGLVALVSLTQLARIHHRVPEYGWTTQKVFHVLNFLCASFRAGVFAFRRVIEAKAMGTGSHRHHHQILWLVFREVVLNLPAALFFTTYALLVLFWGEIYYRAKGLECGGLRKGFVSVNVFVYALLIFGCAAVGIFPEQIKTVAAVGAVFLATASLCTACGFVKYGGALFAMLKKFPPSAKGRRKKIAEVGVVTAVCTFCFVARSAAMIGDAIVLANRNSVSNSWLDSINHPVVDIAYYAVCELFPSALVLFVLRKLPPKTRPHEVLRDAFRENV